MNTPVKSITVGEEEMVLVPRSKWDRYESALIGIITHPDAKGSDHVAAAEDAYYD